MDKNMKKFIYDRHSDIMFSLSGSRVKEIKFHNKMLTLKVDSLFQYVNNEEVEHEGEVCFKGCDLRLCSVLIFNKTLGKGHFMGDAISLEEFMDVHKNCKFEIIKEGYFGNSTTYSGWLWEEGKILYPLLCIFGTVEIWSIVSMVREKKKLDISRK